MPDRPGRRDSLGLALGLAMTFVVALSVPTHEQVRPPGPKRAPLRPINSIDGKDLYNAYCAQCHGTEGKGDGAAAPGLKSPPADLTHLAEKNGGKFNRKAVEGFIRGDRPGATLTTDSRDNPVLMTAHGQDDMPVWGLLFREMWPDQPVAIRCGNLARYVEKLQAR